MSEGQKYLRGHHTFSKDANGYTGEENNSFSGADMVAICHIPNPNDNNKLYPYAMASLQTITYSIHMDRASVRSIGNVNAKGFTDGPRTIAGSMVFAVFDKHFLKGAMDEVSKTLSDSGIQQHFLADEMPPMDITISFANEYGAKARLALYKVRLLNEGQVMSINDIYTENTYQFVATDIEYLDNSNGFSTIGSQEPTNVIGGEGDDVTGIGKETSESVKNNNRPKEYSKLTLRAAVLPVKKGDKTGKVKLSLSNSVEQGSIYLSAKEASYLTIDMSENKNQTDLYLSLPNGYYTATYRDDEKYIMSNPVTFKVTTYTKAADAPTYLPIIDDVTATSITVLSNSPEYTKVKYAAKIEDQDLVFSVVQMTNKKAVLQNLSPATTYIIYNCNDDDTVQSMQIWITTNMFVDQPYDSLKEYIYYNQDKLTYGTVAQYYQVIDEAQQIDLNSSTVNKLTDALAAYIEDVHKHIREIKREDYATPQAYMEAINILNMISLRAAQLLNIATMHQRDIAYSRYNNHIVPSVMPVLIHKPSMPELINHIDCVFSVDETVKYIEFYRPWGNTVQFITRVRFEEMTSYYNGKIFRFIGKPGVKYFVQSVGSGFARSEKLEFYVMTDDEKAAALKEVAAAKTESEQLIANVKLSLIDIGDLNLDANYYNRVMVQLAKKPEVEILSAPAIIEHSATKIAVDVNYKDILSNFNNEYYAVIAEDKVALNSNSTTYKIKFTGNDSKVEFTSDKHGIKHDRSYIVWIEDYNRKQISAATSVSLFSNMTEDMISQEEKIQTYFAGLIVNKVKKILSNKIPVSMEIDHMLDSLRSDDTLNQRNVCKKLLTNAILFRPELPNVNTVVQAICEADMELNYMISDMFFNSAIKYDKNGQIIFPRRNSVYGLTIYKVKVFEGSVSISYNNAIVVAGNEYRHNIDKGVSNFTFAFATGSDIRTKSGLIFIDVLRNDVKAYRAPLEVF